MLPVGYGYYLPTSQPADGKWSVVPYSTAPYKTRVVVYRPANPRKFNGTVIVEWLNVSGGADDAPDWVLTHNELIREGFAWVGVSAQAVGINELTGTDPARYGSLSAPGDSYSYDIFSQAGKAILDDPALLGGLRPRHLIADGESQLAAWDRATLRDLRGGYLFLPDVIELDNAAAASSIG